MENIEHIPSEHNQALDPDWRWQRATYLNSVRKNRRRNEDSWVLLIQKFQNELKRLERPVDHERLSIKYPGLYWAWNWRNRARRDTSWMIEAFLCANDTPGAIAERLLVSKDTVICYSKMYFDVVGKTHHWGYMMNQVLAGAASRGINERDYDLLWKLFGLLKGPIFLETFIKGDSSPGRVSSQHLVADARRQLTVDSLGSKALIAARTTPVAYNQEIIFSTWLKLVEIEEAADSAGQAQGMIVNTLNTLVGGFGFRVGAPDTDTSAVKRLKLDAGVGELRSDEMVRVALGQTIDSEAEILETEFPEAKNDKKD